MERSLREYRAKRDPARTPEPFGVAAAVSPARQDSGGRFVVQQHAARRMHWDLRFEIDGVLASWAVPRGPSVDPRVRRLAVRTEDHPLEYADFEGRIPPGNYGAGAVILWDAGTYRTVDGAAAGAALARGKLDVELHGYKLRGPWALIRTHAHDGKDWLLLKKAEGRPASEHEPAVQQPASILSGLTVEELQAHASRTAALAAQAAAAGAAPWAPTTVAGGPMLAETAARPFSRAGWLFELKYDGVRVLARRAAGGPVSLSYRSGRDVTASFPEVARACAHLPCDDYVIDGEICTLDERGRPRFERLQPRLGLRDAAAVARAAAAAPVVLFCFDLLAVAGYDLRPLPLRVRKQLLRHLVPALGVLRYTEHFERDGERLFAAVEELGAEGIVAKRAASPYQSGRRSRDWQKIKAQRTADVAIVGYMRGHGARAALGALMLAWRHDGELIYAGNVGTGFDTPTLAALQQRLAAEVRRTPAFRGRPPGPASAQVFVEPQLVAEVRYTEVTAGGALRQPIFVRLRDDKDVAQCDAPPRAPAAAAPELPAAAPPQEPLRLSNLDKMFWPCDGYTKGDLLRYYEQMWPALAPYLHDRPVVLTRYPDGIDGKSFFQKNAPGFTPSWVETCRIEGTDYFVCNTVEMLLYVINSGCIPLHVWSVRRGTLQQPDWTILDLDPKGAPFAHVVQLARHLHGVLDALGVPHFVKTSGQDGLHLLVPLAGTLTHAQARLFAEILARLAAAERPDIATVARPLAARGGKVYVDYLQNGFGKTLAAPFSVRPRPGAPVSMPLRWSEVTARLEPGRFTLRSAPARWRRHGDPMRALLQSHADVRAALRALAARLEEAPAGAGARRRP